MPLAGTDEEHALKMSMVMIQGANVYAVSNMLDMCKTEQGRRRFAKIHQRAAASVVEAYNNAAAEMPYGDKE